MGENGDLITIYLLMNPCSLVFTSQEPALPLHLQEIWNMSSSRVGVVYLAAVIPTLICAFLCIFRGSFPCPDQLNYNDSNACGRILRRHDRPRHSDHSFDHLFLAVVGSVHNRWASRPFYNLFRTTK